MEMDRCAGCYQGARGTRTGCGSGGSMCKNCGDEPQNWLTVYFSVLKLFEAELQLRAT